MGSLVWTDNTELYSGLLMGAAKNGHKHNLFFWHVFHAANNHSDIISLNTELMQYNVLAFFKVSKNKHPKVQIFFYAYSVHFDHFLSISISNFTPVRVYSSSYLCAPKQQNIKM